MGPHRVGQGIRGHVEQDPDQCHAVADAVVDPAKEHGAAFQLVDQIKAPEGFLAIQRFVDQAVHQPLQTLFRLWWGEPAEVVAQVEMGVLFPEKASAQPGNDSLAKTGIALDKTAFQNLGAEGVVDDAVKPHQSVDDHSIGVAVHLEPYFIDAGHRDTCGAHGFILWRNLCCEQYTIERLARPTAASIRPMQRDRSASVSGSAG